jgi:hypothetical protein
MDPFAHASIGFMAKPIVPKAPLAILLVATQVPDLLFFAFEAVGMEHQAVTQLDFNQGLQYLSPAVMHWSHGLFMCIVWSLVAAVIAFPFFRDLRTSAVIGLLVFSHWVLDFSVYNNMPVLFGGLPEVGLGLLTSHPGIIAAIILELALIIAGISIYWVYRKRQVAAQGP